MYISVKFWKDEAQGFGGRAYTYKTRLAFLQVGDKVAAPVRTGKVGSFDDKKAVVGDIGLPELGFECNEITKTWTEAEKPETT